MPNPPSGTVTFLFTDIEGSTRLAQEYPDGMPALLARHHAILNGSIQAHDGYVFQVVGDSFAAAFHSASDALHAALDAQRALHQEAWSPAPIKVRMGIHTGTSYLNDLSAPTVYSGYATLATTQRIMSAGHGGQILISGATRELLRDVLPGNTELMDLGEKRLKDLMRAEHLYQLDAAELPGTFPPLKTLDAYSNNLPIQLTSFIGRENEIAEVKQELDEHRLVTLTGSGGTGKTRLSLQVAAELLDHFHHGVWFVELAPLADPDLIPQTILSAIGVQERQGKTPLEVLKDYLREKQTLIVLDNCEHVVSASAQVVNVLLNAAPTLKILASSREALGVRGEASYPVPSLSLPDIKHMPVTEQLSQYEAVRLFIDRALLVSPHFDVNQDNAPAIAQICYRLDGIPLAIELAAARVKVLSVEQISERLDDRFRLLTGGARTALPRQQTLRALIDWSYDLLSENERLLLHHLSVFAGGWTLEATEDVCAVEGIEAYDVLDLLTQLVNKSLVDVLGQSPGAEPRYRMLETIRQYAREKLLEARGSEMLRDRHLAYFVKLVVQAEPELYRFNQIYWLKRLQNEIDNLRIALEWSLATDVESGLRIASLPWRFWHGCGYLRELENWLRQLLERYGIANALHAHALAVYSFYIFRQGRLPKAIGIARQSLEMARALSNKHVEAFSQSLLGIFTVTQGNVGEGEPLLVQSLFLYQALGDKIGQADTTEWLSIDSGDPERAIAFTKESLRLYRELGDLTGIASSLTSLARLTFWSGDVSSPAPWLEEACSISRQLGDESSEAYALSTYGCLVHWQGNYGQANTYFEDAIRLCEKTGDYYRNLWAHVFMGHTVLRQGDLQKARKLLKDSIRHTQEAGLTIALVFALEGLASLHVQLGEMEQATRLLTWADAMREKMGDDRPPIEQASVDHDLDMIRVKLNDRDFVRLSTEGRSMTFEEAVTLALEN